MKKRYAFTLIEILVAIMVFAIGVLAVFKVITGNLLTMDRTNTKLQATVLAKEGLELLYNVRDSNLQKSLNRNCVITPDLYSRTTDELQNKVAYDPTNSTNDFESVICAGYFGTSSFLQLSFDENYYIMQKLSTKSANFDTNFQNNRLCIFSGDAGMENLLWYSNCSFAQNQKEKKSFFARYLSFSLVGSADLPNSNQQFSTSKSKSSSHNFQNSAQKLFALPENKILKVESHVLYDKGGKTGEVVFESFIGNY